MVRLTQPVTTVLTCAVSGTMICGRVVSLVSSSIVPLRASGAAVLNGVKSTNSDDD